MVEIIEVRSCQGLRKYLRLSGGLVRLSDLTRAELLLLQGKAFAPAFMELRKALDAGNVVD